MLLHIKLEDTEEDQHLSLYDRSPWVFGISFLQTLKSSSSSISKCIFKLLHCFSLNPHQHFSIRGITQAASPLQPPCRSSERNINRGNNS